MERKHQFTVGGQVFEISRDEIESRLRGVIPEPITQVFVYVDGKKFPVKQALAVSATLIRSGFTTQEALRVFRKLGLTVGEGALQTPQDLLQIEGRVFNVDGKVWRASVVNSPGANDTDLVIFKIAFAEDGQPRGERFFTATTSSVALHHDADDKYKNVFFEKVRSWLPTEEPSFEFRYMG